MPEELIAINIIPQELTANRKCSAVLENYSFLTATALSEKSEFIEVRGRILERDFSDSIRVAEYSAESRSQLRTT
jgi:hypothetical protein